MKNGGGGSTMLQPLWTHTEKQKNMSAKAHGKHVSQTRGQGISTNHTSVQEEEGGSTGAASEGSESKGTPGSQWGPLGTRQAGAAHAPNLYRNVHGSCGVTAGAVISLDESLSWLWCIHTRNAAQPSKGMSYSHYPPTWMALQGMRLLKKKKRSQSQRPYTISFHLHDILAMTTLYRWEQIPGGQSSGQLRGRWLCMEQGSAGTLWQNHLYLNCSAVHMNLHTW